MKPKQGIKNSFIPKKYCMQIKNKFIFSLLLVVCLSTFLKSNLVYGQDVRREAIKYQNLLALIDRFYVDSVSVSKLTEDAIIKVLSELDPHSVYVSKDEVKEMNEPLQGSFSGVGIQFNILRDTLMVVATIPGGPSEKVGVSAGDRIITIDDEMVAGVGLKNMGVRKRLRGEAGSIVNISIKRRNKSELIDYVITRDKIPIYSLDASYMLNEKTGYVKLNRFSATTAKEFYEALQKLKTSNMENLILDLRGNGGGYMSAAIKVVDQLMKENKLIVYTEGSASKRRDFTTTSFGSFTEGKLFVLIDGGSASASEIVSGAIQDWDRGIILGRRSFGKGLVQRQFPLSDGSMVRLTTAHYHTPTGRCIQKPYDKGVKDYRMDLLKRYKSGEMVNADSIQFPDSLRFQTLNNGRTVYSCGGIMPDVYIPLDTTKSYKYYNLLSRKNVLYPFVVDFMDKNRSKLAKKYPNFELFNNKFVVSEKMMASLNKKAKKKGLKKDEKEYLQIVDELKNHIKALIARDLWDTNEYFVVINKNNEFVNKALEILEKPKLYEQELE